MKKSEVFFGLSKIPCDFAMTFFAFFVAFKLRLHTPEIATFAKKIDETLIPSPTEYLHFSIYGATTLIIVFAIGKMYQLNTTTKLSHEISKVITNGLIWPSLIILYFLLTRSLPFSNLLIVYCWALSVIFVILGRSCIKIIQKKLLKYNIGRHRILFIGHNELSKELFSKFKENKAYQIVGFLDHKPLQAETKAAYNSTKTIKYLGKPDQLEKYIEKLKIDEVIQIKQQPQEAENEKILQICDLKHINYRFIPSLIDVRRSNIIIETIGTIPIISIKPTPLDGWGKITKRIIDILGSIIGLIILSPLMIITAIAIKIDSKGPIIFSKLDDGSPVKRVGQFGQFFTFYKFRSMIPNSHSLRYTDLKDKNSRQDGPLIKIKADPRVTRVGRFIRKYSIDELPQFWNVLIGDMSLVGPRPHLPEEVLKYEKNHRFVLTIKPGITGLAQINGRSSLNFEEEIRLDRYYIENWSIFLDLKIIFNTIFIVLRGYQE